VRLSVCFKSWTANRAFIKYDSGQFYENLYSHARLIRAYLTTKLQEDLYAFLRVSREILIGEKYVSNKSCREKRSSIQCDFEAYINLIYIVDSGWDTSGLKYFDPIKRLPQIY
jgi:hypothetical protein